MRSKKQNVILGQMIEQSTFFIKQEVVSTILSFSFTILIDRDGRIAGRWVGLDEENEFALEKMIKEIIAKQEQQSP